MTTLRVIAEDAVARPADGVSRYSTELTRALIAGAPAHCDVELVFAAHEQSELDAFSARFPGAGRTSAAKLSRGRLATAWRLGVKVAAGSGLVHAPSLFAPLSAHDRLAGQQQLAVTIHDTIAWSHPSSLPSGSASWQRAMAARAQKHADAVVVPSHTVAEQLARHLDFGDRIRVIGGAVSPSIALGPDADARAAALGLPERYVLTVSSMDPRKGLSALIAAMARPELDGVPLLVVGEDEWHGRRISTTAMLAGLPEGRVRVLGRVEDADLAVLLGRAAVFAYPSLAEGFGLSVLEAFTLGTPVVHSDDAALLELGAGAGLAVESGADEKARAAGLAEAISSVTADEALRLRLAVAGRDRARAFSWEDSARRVWQLHADL